MWKRFFRPIQDNRLMYFVGICVMSTWFMFDIFTVRIIKYTWKAIESNDIELVYFLVLWYSVVFIVYYIVKYLIRKWWWAVSRYEFAKYFWRDTLKKFLGLENTYVERMGTWRTISLIQDGINNRIDALLMIQYETPNVLIKVWFTLVLLFQIWRAYVVWFFVLCIFMQFFVSRINGRYLAPLRAQRKLIWVESSRHFVRMVMNKQEITQSKAVTREIDGYIQKVQTQQDLNFTITHFVFFMFNIPLIVVQSLSIVALVYAYISLQDGTFSLWLFSALVAMVWYLWQLMLKATQSFKDLWDQLIHVERLRSYLDEWWSVDYTTWNKFLYKTGDIHIEHLSFAYTEWSPVFERFSLDIAGGKKTALVGMSGSWKSTLIKLIAWYVKPDIWWVHIDGQSLSSLALESYFSHLGYLTQEPNVFDGTIKENLLYSIWSKKITKRLLDQVITQAKCEFIYDLPHWMETEIGERGIKLSGWQRQRLAIAKIFLKNPKIVLLDEPTSSLDSFAEESVTDAMNNLFTWRTVVVVAHRLQTVKHADDIIVLDMGKVVERGNHVDLINKWWYYARMLELQSGF